MLLKPNLKLDKITDITFEMLQKRGIKALILDVDNTLSTHHGMKLCEGLEDWLSLMKSKGVKLLILSNSTRKRVEPFAQKIGLDFIALGLKPLFIGYVRSLKRLRVNRKNTAIVGDQIFTDVLGGNFCGITTILLTPIRPETSLRFRFKRKLEKIVFKLYGIKTTKE
ncbi:MAG TPA: YqeG family HAD IIIA-type phosphatase [Ruminococcaceae bacterium]|nr:YqeG family HAD IIIA-type phosphatase [Oscillospiraceae bacterium]